MLTKSHIRVRFVGVCAHLLVLLRARDGVVFEGVVLEGERSGSGNSFGWPRVDTIIDDWRRLWAY